MAPRKAVDKGKAPMSEVEQEHRPRTRSRGMGISIREAGETEREMEREPQRATHQAETARTSGVPVEEETMDAQTEVPGPSRASDRVLLETMIGMMQAFQEFVRNQGQRQDSPVQLRSERGVTPEPERRRRRVQQDDRADMKSFQDMHPPTFQGELDYRVADRWVTRMEKIFEYLQCTEVQRIRYATYQLEGEADDWWQTERQTILEEERLTWAEFLERFYRHFVPESERSKRIAEFMSLCQLQQTVAEYAAQFVSLRRFVPWAQSDAREAARKFQEGLRPSIRSKVAPFKLVEYWEILDRALVVEREEEELSKIREKRKVHFLEHQDKRPQRLRFDQGEISGGRGVRVEQRQRSMLGQQQRSGPRPQYTCYRCGQPGHRRFECPQGQRSELPQMSQQRPIVTRVPVSGRGRGGGHGSHVQTQRS